VQTRRRRPSWKAEIKWFLAFVVLAHAGLIAFIDWRRPEIHDLEYGGRLQLLRQRRAEEPDRPLCLMIGSSRPSTGFLPEQLPPLRSPSGELVLPFNFSHLGAGPVLNLMELRRLLREGICPRWVVLEIMPTLMTQQRTALPEELSVAPDLPLLQRYVSPVKAWGVYCRRRLNPWYSHRLGLLRHYLPYWATDAGGEDGIRFDRLGGDSTWLRDEIDPELRRRYIAAVRASYLDDLQHFHIDPVPDRAMRDFLELARKEGIECALLVTPESSDYRSWYGPGALDTFKSYCAAIGEEYRLPVIDASLWIPDDQFIDGSHLLRAGADAFTERLGREVLRPLVEGRLGER
jgi:hypothetical protein